MMPIYGALHFIPAVVFRRKAFTQDPGKVLVKAGLGSLRSSAFLGVYVVLYQGEHVHHKFFELISMIPHSSKNPALFCGKHNLHRYLTLLRKGLIPASLMSSPLKVLPQWIIDFLISKASFAILGAAAGLSLFVEEKRRRGELAMYVLPKGLEGAWVMARGKGWVFRTGKWGEMLLTAIGMAMVMVRFSLSSLLRALMNWIL
jgi:hypothetical protein